MDHNTLARICLESYQYSAFNIHECEGIIKYFHDVQVVAFRGTEAGSLFQGAGWLDVVRDMRVMPWRDEDTGWAHSGFLKGGQLAADFLVDKLVMHLPVIFTGHSLGGALALICAIKLHEQGFDVRQWVGFGSPKILLSKRHPGFLQINYRHRNDIVPLLPRWLPYRHHYPVITLDARDKRRPTWKDHGIEHYIRRVR